MPDTLLMLPREDLRTQVYNFQITPKNNFLIYVDSFMTQCHMVKKNVTEILGAFTCGTMSLFWLTSQ